MDRWFRTKHDALKYIESWKRSNVKACWRIVKNNTLEYTVVKEKDFVVPKVRFSVYRGYKD